MAKEYVGLNIVAWVLRVVGGITVLLGGAFGMLAILEARHVEASTILLSLGGPIVSGIIVYAIGDSVGALADIARSTARTAQASEQLSGMVMGQLARMNPPAGPPG